MFKLGPEKIKEMIKSSQVDRVVVVVGFWVVVVGFLVVVVVFLVVVANENHK